MLLALDQSPSKTGFAVGAPNAPPITWGVESFPDGIAREPAWRDFLRDKLGFYKPTCVVIEAPFLPPRLSKVVRQMVELPAIIKLCAADFQCAYAELTAPAWRKHFIGESRAPKGLQESARRTWLKHQAKLACAARGWPVANDDEADALGILDCALYQFFPEHNVSLRYREPINAL